MLTCLSPVSSYVTDLVVEFYAPSIPPDKAQALGDAYLRLYEQLWGEDERMMQRRQSLLDRGWKQGQKRCDSEHDSERGGTAA